MKSGLLTLSMGVLSVILTGCGKLDVARITTQKTILLGTPANMNGKCIGHAQGLCGTEKAMLPTEIAGVFATEPDCQGLKLRALTEQERQIPSDQLPLLFDLFYIGKPHVAPYMGTGKGEDEGWMFSFNGPQGHFSSKARYERDAIRRVCLAAKGQGGEVDQSVGFSH